MTPRAATSLLVPQFLALFPHLVRLLEQKLDLVQAGLEQVPVLARRALHLLQLAGRH